MGREIERKFLVIAELWSPGAAPAEHLVQGYLSLDTARTVRIRIEGDEGRVTIKGVRHGVSRLEFEYPIPLEDARELLQLCIQPLIDKTRYRIDFGGRTWDVDEFHGLNAGLRVAEIELPSEDARFALPPWAGTEVSEDPRYANSCLVRHPFAAWEAPGIQPG